jgi:hypothetical protein
MPAAASASPHLSTTPMPDLPLQAAVAGNERAGNDLSCAGCGYGVATAPPSRCPMCNRATEWVRATPTRPGGW